MWSQTDVNRVISNAYQVLAVFEYTRSPLEQMINEEYQRIKDLRPGERRGYGGRKDS